MTEDPADQADPNGRGYLRPEEVRFPSEEKLSRGPVPVIECPERIPCDPCRENCPAGAIEMEGMNEVPRVDYDRCTGCGLCLQSCPGLAIFILDCSPRTSCHITLPYEFPLPDVGEEVLCLDRKGEKVTRGTITGLTRKDESTGDTPTVTVQVPREHVHEVRNIRRIK